MPFVANDIPIANSALTIVGTRLISTVADASKECTIVRTNWDQWRRAALRDGLWKFAKGRANLDKDASFTPVFGYNMRYPLPADFIRLVAFNDVKGNQDGGDPPYKLMSGYIYTCMGYAQLEYISDVTDSRMWDPLFCEAFSAYIYERTCKTLTGGDPDVRAYNTAMRKAKFSGATEDPSEQLDIDVWMQARVGIPTIGRDPNFEAGAPLFPT